MAGRAAYGIGVSDCRDYYSDWSDCGAVDQQVRDKLAAMTPEQLQEAAAQVGINIDRLQATGILSRLNRVGIWTPPERITLLGHTYAHTAGCMCRPSPDVDIERDGYA